jgi:cytochrome c-type biogenesis protein
VLLGGAFALCATPCVGPALGTTLVLAGSTQTLGEGATLLVCYSLGLALPFVAVGMGFANALRPFRWLGDHYVLLARTLR